MNLQLINSPSNGKYSYQVLIEYPREKQVKASVLGWEGYQVLADSKEEALAKLKELLTNRLENTEIVSLEVEIPKKEHPWLKFAGMFEDDPLFDEVLQDIENYRRELDQEMEIEED